MYQHVLPLKNLVSLLGAFHEFAAESDLNTKDLNGNISQSKGSCSLKLEINHIKNGITCFTGRQYVQLQSV